MNYYKDLFTEFVKLVHQLEGKAFRHEMEITGQRSVIFDSEPIPNTFEWALWKQRQKKANPHIHLLKRNSIGDCNLEFKPNIDNLIKQENSLETKEQVSEFLIFTEKEILKMPEHIRKKIRKASKIFKVEGLIARITKRKSGKKGICYEIRYRKNGYKVEVSDTDLDKAKEKFVIALTNAINKRADANIEYANSLITAPDTFHEFAMHYFEKYKALKGNAKTTNKKMLQQYNLHIKNVFNSMPLKNILPEMCKKLFDKILKDGHGRTCEDVRSILNQIFNFAMVYKKIEINPISILAYTKHERENGIAVSKDNEKKLLKKLKNTDYLLPIVLMLYCGLRPNEIYTAYRDGNFIKANNSKRKNGEVEEKKIGISPMFASHLKNIKFDSKKFYRYDTLRKKLKEILPEHTLKDLRETFSTRAQECGVDKVVVKLFMGHSLTDVLGKHYTDFSDDFLYSESQKIKY